MIFWLYVYFSVALVNSSSYVIKITSQESPRIEHIPGRVRTSRVIPRQTHVEPVSGRRQVVLRVSAKGARAWEGVGGGITACGIFLTCIIKAILLLPFLAI